MDDATHAVMPLDPEMIQIGDAIWQHPAVARPGPGRGAPVLRGSAYYRGVVSSKTFASLDNHLWALSYKWATFRHASKPKKWIVARYFGKYNKLRNDHWVFGDARSLTGKCAQLISGRRRSRSA